MTTSSPSLKRMIAPPQAILIFIFLLIAFKLSQAGYFLIADGLADQLFHPDSHPIFNWMGRAATAGVIALVFVGFINGMTPSVPLFVLFAGNIFILVSCVWAHNIVDSALIVFRSVIYVYAAYVMAHLLSPSNRALAIGLSVLAMGSASAFLIASNPLFAASGQTVGWRGFFAHKNGLAGFCTFGIIGLIWSWPDAKHKLIQWMAMLMALALLAGSLGKTGIILAVCFPIFLGVAKWFDRQETSPALMLVVVMVGATILAAVIEIALSMDRITLTGRTALWAYFWPLAEKTLIFGRGGIPLSDVEFQLVAWRWVGQIHPHNSFIAIVLSVGIVGIFIFFAFLLVSARQFYGAENRHNAMAGLAMIVTYVTYGQVESYFTMSACLPLFIMILFMPVKGPVRITQGLPLSRQSHPAREAYAPRFGRNPPVGEVP